jgi:hypothetical protein
MMAAPHSQHHSVLQRVHFIWLQPALFWVATWQPAQGLVSDLMTFSVSFSDCKLSRAHWEQLFPGWLSPWVKQNVWLQPLHRMDGAAELWSVIQIRQHGVESG